jgi:PAS domain S-box-containing protein
VNDHLEEIISQRTSEVNFKNAVLSTQLEVSPESILFVDEQAKILNVNQKFVELWGVSEELVKEGNDEPVLLACIKSLENPDEAIARIRFIYAQKTERGYDELKLKDGRVIDRDSAPVTGTNGLYYGRVWYFRDVTEIKHSEQALQNVNRALKALSSGIHASNEAQLLQDMCRVIVDVDGYHLAWVC